MLSQISKRILQRAGVRILNRTASFSTTPTNEAEENARTEEEIEDEIFKFEEQWETIAR